MKSMLKRSAVAALSVGVVAVVLLFLVEDAASSSLSPVDLRFFSSFFLSFLADFLAFLMALLCSFVKLGLCFDASICGGG